MSAPCFHDDAAGEEGRLLAAFVDDVRRYGAGPPPRVGPALAEVLAAGTGVAPAPTAPAVQHHPPAGGFVAWLSGRRPRLALGAAITSLTFLGAGAAGALPGPAQSAFDRTADAVGLHLPEAEARQTAPVLPQPDGTPGPGSGEPRNRAPAVPGPFEAVPPVPDAAGPPVPAQVGGGGEARPDPALRQPGVGPAGRGAGAGSGAGAPKDLPASAQPRPSRSSAGPQAPGSSPTRGGGAPAAGEASMADRGNVAAWHWQLWRPPGPQASPTGSEDAGEGRAAGSSAGQRSSGPYPSRPSGR